MGGHLPHRRAFRHHGGRRRDRAGARSPGGKAGGKPAARRHHCGGTRGLPRGTHGGQGPLRGGFGRLRTHGCGYPGHGAQVRAGGGFPAGGAGGGRRPALCRAREGPARPVGLPQRVHHHHRPRKRARLRRCHHPAPQRLRLAAGCAHCRRGALCAARLRAGCRGAAARQLHLPAGPRAAHAAAQAVRRHLLPAPGGGPPDRAVPHAHQFQGGGGTCGVRQGGHPLPPPHDLRPGAGGAAGRHLRGCGGGCHPAGGRQAHPNPARAA